MAWDEHPHREALSDLTDALRKVDDAWEQYCAHDCDEVHDAARGEAHRIPSGDLEPTLAKVRSGLRDAIFITVSSLGASMASGPGIRKET